MNEDFIEAKTHSVVVIDRHRATAEAIGVALATLGPFQIVAEIYEAGALTKLLNTISPALVVTDLGLPGVAGGELIARLRRASSGTRILVFATTENPGEIAAGMAAEPDGFVHRSESGRTLLEAAGMVLAGHRFFSEGSRRLAGRARRTRTRVELTAEEKVLAGLLLEGLQTQEIAVRMKIPLRSLERMRAALMVKLGFQGDLVGFVRWAIREGLAAAG